MVIYNLLVSFEDLQKQVSILPPKSIQVVFFSHMVNVYPLGIQLIALLTPQSLALNVLLCRLIGVQQNLTTLVEVNMQAGQVILYS